MVERYAVVAFRSLLDDEDLSISEELYRLERNCETEDDRDEIKRLEGKLAEVKRLMVQFDTLVKLF